MSTNRTTTCIKRQTFSNEDACNEQVVNVNVGKPLFAGGVAQHTRALACHPVYNGGPIARYAPRRMADDGTVATVSERTAVCGSNQLPHRDLNVSISIVAISCHHLQPLLEPAFQVLAQLRNSVVSVHNHRLIAMRLSHPFVVRRHLTYLQRR